MMALACAYWSFLGIVLVVEADGIGEPFDRPLVAGEKMPAVLGIRTVAVAVQISLFLVRG